MPSRKKIVFVLSGYGRAMRGAERMVSQLVEGLADEFDVAVLGGGEAAPGAIPLSFLSRDSRWTHRINRTPGLGHMCRTLQLDPLNWEWLSCAWTARAWLRENPCDLLVPEGGRWGGWLGHWLRHRQGTPFIDIAHGAPSRWEMAAARRRPDCYVTPTQSAAAAMQHTVPGLRTVVIPPGIDTRQYTPQGSAVEWSLPRPIVLSVGALELLKDMERVLRAVHAWGRGSAVIIGEGPERERLQQIGNQLLGPDRFALCRADPGDMPRYYRSADVIMSASRSEAYGLVYLEALASGCPVVTRDDVVRQEVLAHRGLFVVGDDPNAWAQALQDACDSPAVVLDNAERSEMDSVRMISQYRELMTGLLRA